MKRLAFALLAVLWLCMMVFSFFYQVESDKKYAYQITAQQAEMFFHHIVLMRLWNAQHGGVYVRVTEQSPPNPYLKIPNRDITAPDGTQLTLLNPAYMTRQMAELEASHSGIRFHLTSLNPINPTNQADPWETEAFAAFKQGSANYTGLSELDRQPYFRYMAPLKIEQDCMRCHAEQGLKPGQLIGAISVSLPAVSIERFVEQRKVWLQQSHVMVAVAGLLALFLVYWLQTRLSYRLSKAQQRMRLAYLDALTILPNRRYYDAFLSREWKRAMRHRYPLSMIMIDIDFFKPYNDSLGHAEGDHCLKLVAKTLRRFFRRSGDLIARYGGEEFCVVAACDSEQIQNLAEMLRKAVENMKLPHPDSEVSAFVTISLGVATLVPGEEMESKTLLLNADQALYRAKHLGRNQVAVYQVDLIED